MLRPYAPLNPILVFQLDAHLHRLRKEARLLFENYSALFSAVDAVRVAPGCFYAEIAWLLFTYPRPYTAEMAAYVGRWIICFDYLEDVHQTPMYVGSARAMLVTCLLERCTA